MLSFILIINKLIYTFSITIFVYNIYTYIKLYMSSNIIFNIKILYFNKISTFDENNIYLFYGRGNNCYFSLPKRCVYQ